MRSENGLVIWFTGLPCSGKTTLSNRVKESLSRPQLTIHQLDGDLVRSRQTMKLGFTKEDRIKNVQGVVLEAAALAKTGSLVLVSLIAPYQTMRDYARTMIERYVEVYVKCPLSVCEARDVKGMYRMAREGKITHFTGLSDPYEQPAHADVTVETNTFSIEACALQVITRLTLAPVRANVSRCNPIFTA